MALEIAAAFAELSSLYWHVASRGLPRLLIVGKLVDKSNQFSPGSTEMDTPRPRVNIVSTVELIHRARQAAAELRRASELARQQLSDCHETFRLADEELRQARKPHA
jgi:hypothetical protein